jgi:hypothetical protein
MPIPSRYSEKTVVQSIPAQLWEKENAHRNHFAAHGGDLVHLVFLVYLVCLLYVVRRTRETRQTHAPDKPPGDVARCLSGQFNIHHSTLNILFPHPLPSQKAPASCVYIPLLSIVLAAQRRSGGLLDLGVDSAWLTYFRAMELSQYSKRVEPMRALLPGVSD